MTGGSRGIGRAAVNAFASLGANVVINYVRDEQAASEAVDAAERAGVSALAVRADVSHLDEAERLIQEVIDKFERLDFLVCNAGIWEGGAVDALSEGAWDRTMNLNLKGTWTACRLGPLGINVNSVAPGWVDTDMCAEVFADPNFRKSIEDTIPVGRVATPADIGWPIVFLCSEWSRHINGEVLNVNGGSVLCG